MNRFAGGDLVKLSAAELVGDMEQAHEVRSSARHGPAHADSCRKHLAPKKERPPVAAVSPKSVSRFFSGGCEREQTSCALPLPPPAKQTQRAEAGG